MKAVTGFFTASIQRKMFFGFAILVGLVLVMVVGGFFQLTQVRESVIQIVPTSAQMENLQNFALNVSSLDADLERFFVIGGSQFREAIAQDLVEISTALALMKTSVQPEMLPTLTALEQAVITLENEIAILLTAETAGLSSREINERIISVYAQIDQINQLHQELSAATLFQLQDSARQQATIVSNVVFQFLISGSLVFLILVIAAVVVTRTIATPLAKLADTAAQIADGDLNARAPEISQDDEVGRLAVAFNTMTAQLRTLITSLEERVAARTRRLETIANLGEQLSAILNVEQLLDQLVNSVKDRFDYYHAHVYTLDPTRQNLVMTAGAGQAGIQMKAEGHTIPLNAPTSLVARAARSGEIVWVDNVREADDWLPNPLLPDTYAEMAVPIVLEGEVMGVLDVQEDDVGGLDEGDATLLRSLASQVAVAIRNARLFDQVETALAQAQAAQEQYVEQAWQKTRSGPSGGQYLYVRPAAEPVGESRHQVMATARQQALRQKRPAVISLDSDEAKTQSLVAPISLRNKAIGTLQLHASDEETAWNEDDLMVIEAVLEQLAQTADNLRLFDETRSRAGREQIIRTITERMRAANNLDDLLKVTAQALGQQLSAGHAVIELGMESETGQTENGQEH